MVRRLEVFESPEMSGCSSVVEHDLAKVGVEGSNPFARSKIKDPGDRDDFLLTGNHPRVLMGSPENATSKDGARWKGWVRHLP